MFPLVKLYTFKVACQLFMSIEDKNEIERLSREFNLLLKGLISLPINLPGTSFYKAMKGTTAIRKELLQVVKKRLLQVVKKRREALEQKIASPSQDILSHLLSFPDENGKYMSEHPQVYQNILQGQYAKLFSFIHIFLL